MPAPAMATRRDALPTVATCQHTAERAAGTAHSITHVSGGVARIAAEDQQASDAERELGVHPVQKEIIS